MLVYEISKKAKRKRWRALMSEIAGGLVTGSFAWLRLQEAEGSVLSLAVFGLIAFASLLALVHATRSFVANFLFGEIHYRIIVNSNTLALKRGGHPAVFIKRWDCIALAQAGTSLVLFDGSEHVPKEANFDHKHYAENFWRPFLDLWWPGLTPEHLEAYYQEFLTESREVQVRTIMLVVGSIFLVTLTYSFADEYMTNYLYLMIPFCAVLFYFTVRAGLRVTKAVSTYNAVQFPLDEWEANFATEEEVYVEA